MLAVTVTNHNTPELARGVLLLASMTDRDLNRPNVLEAVLFAGPLAAANRERAHLVGELGELAIAMLRRWRPRAPA